MATKKKDNKYEQVYTELLEFVINLHERNKKRIKYGKIFILILPVILTLILLLTNGDKIVFLILWIIIMILTSAYLIGIEYLDENVREKLLKLTDKKMKLDSLIENPKLTKKLDEIRSNLKKNGGSK